MGRFSEMKNKADFEQILEMKMPFNGLNGRKIEAFWQLGRVEMRAIPFGGLKILHRNDYYSFPPFFVEMRAIPFGGLKPPWSPPRPTTGRMRVEMRAIPFGGLKSLNPFQDTRGD